MRSDANVDFLPLSRLTVADSATVSLESTSVGLVALWEPGFTWKA